MTETTGGNQQWSAPNVESGFLPFTAISSALVDLFAWAAWWTYPR